MEDNRTKQKDLVSVLGVKNRQSITGYVDGSTLPTIDKLIALSDYYGVSVDYLLGRVKASSPEEDMMAVARNTQLSDIAVERLVFHSAENSAVHKYLDLLLSSEKLPQLLEAISEVSDEVRNAEKTIGFREGWRTGSLKTARQRLAFSVWQAAEVFRDIVYAILPVKEVEDKLSAALQEDHYGDGKED